jgi:hypothetical protein
VGWLVSIALAFATGSEVSGLDVSLVTKLALAAGRWMETGIKLPNPRPSLDCVILVRSSGVLAMGIPCVMFHVEHVVAETTTGRRRNRIGELTTLYTTVHPTQNTTANIGE